ncbi:MAG: ATP-binding cassette domain-containing protein [Clostridiales Family XIII bacterium]|nr:ATP-binding cassette domain-containing protein [Clostridiales Family XIII bacterium]
MENNTIYFKIKKELAHFTLDVECSFERGTLVIQGESGSGKTTILNCLSGLMMPDSGQVVVDGVRYYDSDTNHAMNLATKERRISYMFQNYALFPNMNIEHNILYGLKNLPEYKEKHQRKELLEYADDIMQKYRIDHLRKKSPKRISGGEKQRVALARAIVTKPKLLLLDEPFSALDEDTKEMMYDEFLQFKKDFDIKTILITHSSAEANLLADTRFRLERGQIRASEGCTCT